jgi:hypothetical protein
VESVLDVADAKARVPNSRECVARRPATAERTRPEEAVDGALYDAEGRVAGADVLVEPQLAVGAQNPSELPQRAGRIVDAAEHPDHDRGVEGIVVGRKGLRSSGDDLDRDGRDPRAPNRGGPRHGIGLYSDHLLHAFRIELEGAPVATAELEDTAAKAREQALAVLARDRIGTTQLTPLEVAREARLLRPVERPVRPQLRYFPLRSISSMR